MKLFIFVVFLGLSLGQAIGVTGEDQTCEDYSFLLCKECKEAPEQFLINFTQLHAYVLRKKDQLLLAIFKITTDPDKIIGILEHLNKKVSFSSKYVLKQYGDLTNFDRERTDRDEYCSSVIRNFKSYLKEFHKEIAVYNVPAEESLLVEDEEESESSKVEGENRVIAEEEPVQVDETKTPAIPEEKTEVQEGTDAAPEVPAVPDEKPEDEPKVDEEKP